MFLCCAVQSRREIISGHVLYVAHAFHQPFLSDVLCCRMHTCSFFHRYKLLESANYPVWNYGNLIAMILLAFCLFCAFTQYDKRINVWAISIVLAVASFLFCFCLTFVFTAPTIGRFSWVRRLYLSLIHYVLCRFMESIDWCTGCNRTGYMMHLTSQKLLAYGYVSAEEMEKVCSMAIVRNPYSRMVSIYNYNKFGRFESFQHFVKDWHRRIIKSYRESAEMDEWYTPCHAIPQFEFTHYRGKQLCQSIVKQEELKFLKTKDDTPQAIAQDSTVADLPEPVLDALLGMPHTNARKTSKKWFEYYDQETLDLTYEMYQHDFVVFDYPAVLEQRPDLQPPALYRKEQLTADDESLHQHLSPKHLLESMVRDSSKSSVSEQSLRRKSMNSASTSGSVKPGDSIRSSMVGASHVLDETKMSVSEHAQDELVSENGCKLTEESQQKG